MRGNFVNIERIDGKSDTKRFSKLESAHYSAAKFLSVNEQNNSAVVSISGPGYPPSIHKSIYTLELTDQQELRLQKHFEQHCIINNTSRVITTKLEFPGVLNMLLSHQQLVALISSPKENADWFSQLSKIKAVYLILDTQNGYQYVGAALGNTKLTKYVITQRDWRALRQGSELQV